MRYSISWYEKKNEDWIVLNLVGDDQKGVDNVSVNRKNKKGEVFPNFDQISNGGTIEGELWQSGQGKWYLFAPKPVSEAPRGSGGAFKQRQILETMEKKGEQIARSQDEKQYAIKVSSTFTAAWNTAIAEWQEQKRVAPMTAQPLEKLFEKWREYFWLRHDVNETDFPPIK